MILTDKCKEEFIDYLRNNKKASMEIGVLRLHWQEYPKEYLNALIIEFFDSTNLFIHIDNMTNCFDEKMNKKWNAYIKIPYTNRKKVCEWYDSRSEATQSAILKANEIFNNLNK
jgi:hypothetical protein